MPTRPPHHVSSLAFRISRLFRISPDLSGRIIQNEPNSDAGMSFRAPGCAAAQSRGIRQNTIAAGDSISTNHQLRAKNAKRTQFRPAGYPNCAKQTQFTVPQPSRQPCGPLLCETNRIIVRARHAVPLQYETNPILAPPVSPRTKSAVALFPVIAILSSGKYLAIRTKKNGDIQNQHYIRHRRPH